MRLVYSIIIVLLFVNCILVAQIDVYSRYHNLDSILVHYKHIRSFTFDSTHSVIPREISVLKNLEDVRFEYSKIKTLPDEFFQLPLKNLVFVGTTELDIEEVVKNLKQCDSLKFLGFSELGLTEMPQGICKLHNLSFIGFWKNNLKTLPECVGELSKLEGIGLTDNSIKTLPRSLGQLPHLTAILLDGNNLQEMPVNYEYIKNLEVISLADNPIGKNINVVLKQLAEYKKLQVINLANCSLVGIPLEVTAFTELDNLIIYSNNFKEFPLGILKLTSLQDLDLGNNSIQSIPEGITDSLPKLKRFILSYNEINRLPLDIENWFQKNISLQIRENKLSDFDRKRLREIFKNKVVE